MRRTCAPCSWFALLPAAAIAVSACGRPESPRADDDGEGDGDAGFEIDGGAGGDSGSPEGNRPPDEERDCMGPDEDCAGWDDGDSSGLVETPEGWLTLDGTAKTLHVIWPSSAPRGDIFRVDTRTQEIEGAYWTGPNHGGRLAPFVTDSPSRTAVDDDGNVLVANRTFRGDELASVTKIAANPDTCPDRDGNGRIDTSTGWDDKLSFDGHGEWEDECILWHTVVGEATGAIARAITLHREVALDGVMVERAWVGLYEEQVFEQIDAATGELTGIEVSTASEHLHPYGAAVDREGWVWITGISATVGRFDASDPEDSFHVVRLPEGSVGRRVVVDENDAPWVGGSDVWRWDRDREEWDAVGLLGTGNIASDGRGSMWAGTDHGSGEVVHRIDNDAGLRHRAIPTPGVRTFGTAVDFEGRVWAFGLTGETVTIDVETEDVESVLAECGGPCLQGPYVRGDITGLQRLNAVDPGGVWSTVVEGCPVGATDWRWVALDALTPAGTSIEVSARTADDLDALSAAPWLRLGVLPRDGRVFDLDDAFAGAGIADGALLAVRVALRSEDRIAAPTLRGVEVARGCDEVLE